MILCVDRFVNKNLGYLGYYLVVGQGLRFAVGCFINYFGKEQIAYVPQDLDEGSLGDQILQLIPLC